MNIKGKRDSEKGYVVVYKMKMKMKSIKMLTAKGPLLLWDLKDKSIQAHVSSVSSVSRNGHQIIGAYISMVI